MTELESVGITPVGLEVIERLDAQRDALTSVVSDIEARVGEFSGRPTDDAILDFYFSVHDAITGRITDATAPAEIARVLAEVFEGIWVELADDALRARFVLQRPIDGGPLSWLPAGSPIEFQDVPVDGDPTRDVLPSLLGPCISDDGGR
jgi:hypothetical protein